MSKKIKKSDYERFKSGHTFESIRQELKREQKKKYDNNEYMFVTRHTVLGRLKQRKLEAYKAYLAEREKHRGHRKSKKQNFDNYIIQQPSKLELDLIEIFGF